MIRPMAYFLRSATGLGEKVCCRNRANLGTTAMEKSTKLSSNSGPSSKPVNLGPTPPNSISSNSCLPSKGYGTTQSISMECSMWTSRMNFLSKFSRNNFPCLPTRSTGKIWSNYWKAILSSRRNRNNLWRKSREGIVGAGKNTNLMAKFRQFRKIISWLCKLL